MSRYLLAAPLASACFAAFCQVPVSVESTTPDSVGSRLSFQLKELFLSSKQFSEPSKSAGKLVVKLVTLSPSDDQYNAPSTIYAVTYVWDAPGFPRPFYLGAMVGTCGRNKVATCAEDVIADALQTHDRFLKP